MSTAWLCGMQLLYHMVKCIRYSSNTMASRVYSAIYTKAYIKYNKIEATTLSCLSACFINVSTPYCILFWSLYNFSCKMVKQYPIIFDKFPLPHVYDISARKNNNIYQKYQTFHAQLTHMLHVNTSQWALFSTLTSAMSFLCFTHQAIIAAGKSH